MKTHDFWYDLPEELIAQTPLEKRDTSRLLKLDRISGQVEHHHFYDIIDYLHPGDCGFNCLLPLAEGIQFSNHLLALSHLLS